MDWADFKLQFEVSDFVSFDEYQSNPVAEKYPVIACADLQLLIPFPSEQQAFGWPGVLHCYGGEMETSFGVLSDKCVPLSVGNAFEIDPDHLILTMAADAEVVLSTDLADVYSALAPQEIVEKFTAMTRDASRKIQALHAPMSFYWLRTQWPDFVTDKALLAFVVTAAGEPTFQLYLRASSDTEKNSRMSSRTGHVFQRGGHCTELEWGTGEQAQLTTLDQTLAFLNKIHQMVDVSIHKCVTAADTAKGLLPVQLDYLQWYSQLASETVASLDGVTMENTQAGAVSDIEWPSAGGRLAVDEVLAWPTKTREQILMQTSRRTRIIEGKGHCLFAAISDQLEQLGRQFSAFDLRRIAMEEAANNWSFYEDHRRT